MGAETQTLCWQTEREREREREDDGEPKIRDAGEYLKEKTKKQINSDNESTREKNAE